MVNIVWERQAKADRETIWRYLYREAGLSIANATDKKFIEAVFVLKSTPKAGMKTEKSENKRKLVLGRLPFVIVYILSNKEVRVFRVLYTARKATL